MNRHRFWRSQVLAGAVGGLIVGSALLLLGAVGYGPQPDGTLIVKNRIQLQDASGKIRCEISAGDNGVGIYLFDSKGTSTAKLNSSSHGTAFHLADSVGNDRVELATSKFGQTIALYDATGNTIWIAK